MAGVLIFFFILTALAVAWFALNACAGLILSLAHLLVGEIRDTIHYFGGVVANLILGALSTVGALYLHATIWP